jgi:hypothetical protein
MNPVKIAFDVDGTLRCNCTDTCADPNERQVSRFKAFATDKNTEMYVWSGGGAEYARRFADMYDSAREALSLHQQGRCTAHGYLLRRSARYRTSR